MKPVLIISAIVTVLVVCCVSNAATTIEEEWKQFKENFKKSYKDAAQEQNRFKIWLKNKLYIEEHNRNISASTSSRGQFYLGQNHLTDWTGQEYKRLLGLRSTRIPFQSTDYPVLQDYYDPSNLLNIIYYTNTVPLSELPASVNWTAQGYVNPVEDQGSCGDCWAFSAAGSMEGLYYNTTRTSSILSEQNLLDCSSTSPYDNEGCNGGNMLNAFQYVIDNKGIDTFNSYPYTGVQTTCRYGSSNSVGYVTGYRVVQPDNEAALQQAVALIGPISVGINAGSMQFQFYKGGIYQPAVCSPNNLDHAVLAVGYGMYNNQPYWLLKNSWGTDWGIQGYMMLARNDSNLCGIASDASFPTGFVLSGITQNNQESDGTGGASAGANPLNLVTLFVLYAAILLSFF